MGRRDFRAAAVVAVVMALIAALVAWTHHLPLRDPDGASLPTWFRLPVIVASAVLLDVLARWALVVSRNRTFIGTSLRGVLVERFG